MASERTISAMTRLGEDTFNVDLLRPWLDAEGKSWVTLGDRCQLCGGKGWSWNNGKQDNCVHCDGLGKINLHDLPSAMPAVLTKAQWKGVDESCRRAFFYETPLTWLLRSVAEYSGFDGMARMRLEQESIKDVEEGENSDVTWAMKALPLPITHCDFACHDPVPAAAQRVGEMIESVVAGAKPAKNAGYASPIFGLLNHPHLAKVNQKVDLDGPGNVWVSLVLNMVQQARDNKFHGPYLFLYNGLDRWLDRNHKPGTTVRDHILTVRGLLSITRIPAIPEKSLVLVQAMSCVVRIVVGQEPVVVQWDEEGNFKFLTICVPQVRSDSYNKLGVVAWQGK